MCKHEPVRVIKEDPMPLFQINYCKDCDLFVDGFGYPVEFKPKRMIEN